MRYFLITVCMCMIAMFHPVSASATEDIAYLDDSIKIMMRSGQGFDFRIIAMLPLGQKISVLEAGEEWVRIRTDEGREGWVLKRFVGNEVPYRIKFDELQKQYTEILKNLSVLEQKNSLLVIENQELKKRLETEVGTMRSQIEKFTRENMILRDAAANRFIKWALAGAGVLFFGFLVGYVVKRERRSSYYL